VVGCFLNREVNLVFKDNAKGVTPHINRAYPLANYLNGELVTFTLRDQSHQPHRSLTVTADIPDGQRRARGIDGIGARRLQLAKMPRDTNVR